ncbi:IS256 family transposase [Flavihumibacter sp. UBA7668]|uniref:IS256 family transposase n=1 Tax=Flavihumibacter sp. UBA7668 TaxID=1946542 RepID=UPI0025BC9B41|nr:IS256 family transposase [Flavihumibacter sp. UBA7668]
MENNHNQSLDLPKNFFKQFKNKEAFQTFFNSLYKEGIEQMLQGELDEHLGYEKYSKEGNNSGNSRNGTSSKKVHTESLGDMVLKIPRDRNSAFSPKLIPKGQRMSDQLEEAIISMYGRGMSTADISEQVKLAYKVEISEGTVSHVTARVMEHVREWQNRALEPLYLVVWMDGIVLKIKTNGRYVNRCVYLIVGIKPDGLKEVLGMWIAENESASFWVNVLTDIKSRGVQDILIACTDNLKGFTDAIIGIFPQTVTQLCVVHQIRNSCKYVVYKDRKPFCKDLKEMYTAPNKALAEHVLETIDQKWGSKYRLAIQSWRNNWACLTHFFDYPMEIRRMIYTTNTIENLNRNIRKYTKTKLQFPDDQAAEKAVYLAIMNSQRKWSQPPHNWGLVLHQFVALFAERCQYF